jgi:hypothetical protein
MKRLTALFVVCIFGLFAGCMKIDARYSYDNKTNFSTLTTYEWMPGVQESFSSKEYADLYQKVMDTQLSSKGFKLSSIDPDFLIRTSPSKRFSEVYLTMYGEVEFHSGKIVVEILDAKTNKIIWEGIARAYVSEEDKPDEVKRGISIGVEKLMTGFPPSL